MQSKPAIHKFRALILQLTALAAIFLISPNAATAQPVVAGAGGTTFSTGSGTGAVGGGVAVGPNGVTGTVGGALNLGNGITVGGGLNLGPGGPMGNLAGGIGYGGLPIGAAWGGTGVGNINMTREGMNNNPDNNYGLASPPSVMREWCNAHPMGAYCVANKDFPQGSINYGPQGQVAGHVMVGQNPGVVWPEIVAPSQIFGSDQMRARWAVMKQTMPGIEGPAGAMPLTTNYAATIAAVSAQIEAEVESSPEMAMDRAKEEQNQSNQTSADTQASIARANAGSAIDYVAHYLYNFTSDDTNKWNQVRNNLFLPMALLILLPGAVLAQTKAIVASGNPVVGHFDVVSPIEGLLRSIIAIFLIPSTYLFINYGIDVANSITYTIQSEYNRIFGTDMYQDAMCAEVRAFPFRDISENLNYVPSQVGTMGMLGQSPGFVGAGPTPFAQFEGDNLEVKLQDPCAGIYIDPKNRANEMVSYEVNSQRNIYNTMNTILTVSWNIMCAFQQAYLYYLWFAGPIVAALWVYPVAQLRSAFPNWIQGVACVCFWSLFWSTVVLLMACLRGVDETGTMMMTALNFLATASVKSAFDFAGLAKRAGDQVGSAALKQASVAGAAKGGGAGKKGAQGNSTNNNGQRPSVLPPGSHPIPGPHPSTVPGPNGTSGATNTGAPGSTLTGGVGTTVGTVGALAARNAGGMAPVTPGNVSQPPLVGNGAGATFVPASFHVGAGGTSGTAANGAAVDANGRLAAFHGVPLGHSDANHHPVHPPHLTPEQLHSLLTNGRGAAELAQIIAAAGGAFINNKFVSADDIADNNIPGSDVLDVDTTIDMGDTTQTTVAAGNSSSSLAVSLPAGAPPLLTPGVVLATASAPATVIPPPGTSAGVVSTSLGSDGHHHQHAASTPGSTVTPVSTAAAAAARADQVVAAQSRAAAVANEQAVYAKSSAAAIAAGSVVGPANGSTVLASAGNSVVHSSLTSLGDTLYSSGSTGNGPGTTNGGTVVASTTGAAPLQPAAQATPSTSSFAMASASGTVDVSTITASGSGVTHHAGAGAPSGSGTAESKPDHLGVVTGRIANNREHEEGTFLKEQADRSRSQVVHAAESNFSAASGPLHHQLSGTAAQPHHSGAAAVPVAHTAQVHSQMHHNAGSIAPQALPHVPGHGAQPHQPLNSVAKESLQSIGDTLYSGAGSKSALNGHAETGSTTSTTVHHGDAAHAFAKQTANVQPDVAQHHGQASAHHQQIPVGAAPQQSIAGAESMHARAHVQPNAQPQPEHLAKNSAHDGTSNHLGVVSGRILENRHHEESSFLKEQSDRSRHQVLHAAESNQSVAGSSLHTALNKGAGAEPVNQAAPIEHHPSHTPAAAHYAAQSPHVAAPVNQAPAAHASFFAASAPQAPSPVNPIVADKLNQLGDALYAGPAKVAASDTIASSTTISAGSTSPGDMMRASNGGTIDQGAQAARATETPPSFVAQYNAAAAPSYAADSQSTVINEGSTYSVAAAAAANHAGYSSTAAASQPSTPPAAPAGGDTSAAGSGIVSKRIADNHEAQKEHFLRQSAEGAVHSVQSAVEHQRSVAAGPLEHRLTGHSAPVPPPAMIPSSAPQSHAAAAPSRNQHAPAVSHSVAPNTVHAPAFPTSQPKAVAAPMNGSPQTGANELKNAQLEKLADSLSGNDTAWAKASESSYDRYEPRLSDAGLPMSAPQQHTVVHTTVEQLQEMSATSGTSPLTQALGAAASSGHAAQTPSLPPIPAFVANGANVPSEKPADDALAANKQPEATADDKAQAPSKPQEPANGQPNRQLQNAGNPIASALGRSLLSGKKPPVAPSTQAAAAQKPASVRDPLGAIAEGSILRRSHARAKASPEELAAMEKLASSDDQQDS